MCHPCLVQTARQKIKLPTGERSDDPAGWDICSPGCLEDSVSTEANKYVRVPVAEPQCGGDRLIKTLYYTMKKSEADLSCGDTICPSVPIHDTRNPQRSHRLYLAPRTTEHHCKVQACLGATYFRVFGNDENKDPLSLVNGIFHWRARGGVGGVVAKGGTEKIPQTDGGRLPSGSRRKSSVTVFASCSPSEPAGPAVLSS